jgi:HSP20 family molecular chaperone IbpA
VRITLAVAGFRPDELEVSVEDGELAIRGKQLDEAAKD